MAFGEAAEKTGDPPERHHMEKEEPRFAEDHPDYIRSADLHRSDHDDFDAIR